MNKVEARVEIDKALANLILVLEDTLHEVTQAGASCSSHDTHIMVNALRVIMQNQIAMIREFKQF